MEKCSCKFSIAFHSHGDGETEVVNRSLGGLFCCIVGYKLKDWGFALSQPEFGYNNALNRSTVLSPFQVAHGVSPQVPSDSAVLPLTVLVSLSAEEFANRMVALHDLV